MPEHVHLLVNPLESTANIGRLLGKVKQPFSKEIKALLLEKRPPLLTKLTVQERPGKSSFRFWQEGAGSDRNLCTTAAVMASIDYIHMNPAKRGLCQRTTDGHWSSARYYLADPPTQQFADMPRIHGLPL